VQLLLSFGLDGFFAPAHIVIVFFSNTYYYYYYYLYLVQRSVGDVRIIYSMLSHYVNGLPFRRQKFSTSVKPFDFFTHYATTVETRDALF
jgi:hypothetical protein